MNPPVAYTHRNTRMHARMHACTHTHAHAYTHTRTHTHNTIHNNTTRKYTPVYGLQKNLRTTNAGKSSTLQCFLMVCSNVVWYDLFQSAKDGKKCHSSSLHLKHILHTTLKHTIAHSSIHSLYQFNSADPSNELIVIRNFFPFSWTEQWPSTAFSLSLFQCTIVYNSLSVTSSVQFIWSICQLNWKSFATSPFSLHWVRTKYRLLAVIVPVIVLVSPVGPASLEKTASGSCMHIPRITCFVCRGGRSCRDCFSLLKWE